jgi:hypothetical protein
MEKTHSQGFRTRYIEPHERLLFSRQRPLQAKGVGGLMKCGYRRSGDKASENYISQYTQCRWSKDILPVYA